jgi:Tol biopolymer transport system component
VQNLGKNIVILLALLGAGFFLAYIRFRPHLEQATSWTDGETVYKDEKPADIRYALWENPKAFDGRVNSDEDELRPALSPDGQYLVFASGEKGLNQDLYISEVLNGEPQEPRPLFEINTSFDEATPAFSNDALFFASNREGGAGGMDLYRVSYRDGVFGRAEALVGEGVNTAADEVDPAPVPGQLAIAFASDRARGARTDYDLYLAKPAGASGLIASAIAELNTPFNEREPAFVGDARTMIFATDRIDGSKGGYDLWRSVQDHGHWILPENQGGLNSEADERGPAPSPDGFSLVFSVETPDRSADLYQAQSRELFRMPGRPVGWLDFLILGGLLLLAILAWLAKRWKAVDLVYKCFLIALMIHALMLLWFKEVFPESEPTELPVRETMFKVRLAVAPTRTSATNKEFGGAVEATRSETAEMNNPERTEVEVSEAVESIQAAPTRTMQRTETALASNPQRAEIKVQETETAKPTEVAKTELQKPTEKFEKRENAAESLQVAAASDLQVERTTQTSDNPQRTEIQTDPTEVAAMPTERSQARAVRQLENAPVFASQPTELMELAAASKPVSNSNPVDVAQPTESVEKIENAMPTFEVAMADPTAEFTPTVRAAEGPQRQSVRPLESAETGESEAEPVLTPGSGLELGDGGFQSGTALAVAAPTRQTSEFQPERVSQASVPQFDVSEPTAESDPSLELGTLGLEGGPTTEDALLADLGASSPTERTEAEATGPSRLEASESTSDDPLAEFDPTMAMADISVERPNSMANPSGPTRDMSDFIPEASAPSSLPEVALSDTVELPPSDVEGAPAEESNSFEDDLLAGVTTLNAPNLRFGDIAGPVKSAPEMSADALDMEVGPSFSPLAAMEEIRAPEPEIPLLAEELDHTPYRNRFGVQKDIAIREHGGSKETEAAVAAGLAYLATLQNEAGYWGSRSDRQQKYRDVMVGKTALSLLAFFGAGHTPESGTEYSDVTKRGVDYLLGLQDYKTGHFGDSSSYGHGISTYALAECYALTQDTRLKKPLEKAIKWVLQKQHKSMDPKLDGGWGYYFVDSDGYQSDRWPRISVTSWQVMALESARIGGLEVPDEAFERARRFLRGSVDPRFGWVRYSHNPSRLSSSYPTLPASTPAGLFAASLVGEDIMSDFYKDARQYTLERAPNGYGYRGDDAFVLRAEGNLYFWYYGSLAMFRAGGEAWEQWNEGMKTTLLDAQDEDGSWKPISIYARYAGDDWRDKSYTTAMCVLTLEVYYRYFTPLMSINPTE